MRPASRPRSARSSAAATRRCARWTASTSVGEGERVGFLGPNGAGKTTTLKMLSGLLHPTAGEVTVAGHVPRRREPAFLSQITLVAGQKQQLLWDLPPSETFAMNRAIYDIPRAQFEETVEELVRLLELGDLVQKPTRQLSLGERMKRELAAALLRRPRVLFLDEPTIGLDVSMQATVRSFVRAYNERFGATVLLTSHYMEDVVQLCPRVIVIDRGRLIYDGDLRALALKVRPDKASSCGSRIERRDAEGPRALQGEWCRASPDGRRSGSPPRTCRARWRACWGRSRSRTSPSRTRHSEGDVGALPGVAGAGDGGVTYSARAEPVEARAETRQRWNGQAVPPHCAVTDTTRTRARAPQGDAQVLARELHGGEDGQHRVALATPRGVGGAHDGERARRHPVREPALLALQRRRLGDDGHERPGAHRRAARAEHGARPPRMGATRRRASATRSARRCGSRFTFE